VRSWKGIKILTEKNNKKQFSKKKTPKPPEDGGQKPVILSDRQLKELLDQALERAKEITKKYTR